VVELMKDSDGWTHKIRNWVNKGEAVGQAHPDLDAKLTSEIMDRVDNTE